MKKFLIIILVFTVSFFVKCSSDKTDAIDHDTDHVTVEAEPAGQPHEEGEEAENHEEEVDSSYTLLTVKKQPFSYTLRTGGRITVDSRDIIMITAKTSGLVKLLDDYLFPGVKISKGDVLFTISGEQLTEGNTELNFRQVKVDLDRATANYERAKRLIEDKIITQEDFLSAKNEYEKLLNTYENLFATTGQNGNMVVAVSDGYVKEIFVTEGQKVSPGDLLASIVMEHNLVLKADVSPDMIDILPTITDANFSVGYSDKIYKLSEMNGRKISQGKSTGANSYYIPVFFRMDHSPELIDGTFAEVYLIGSKIKDAIVVPNTALMEEFGKIFVFVADDDGDFLKRYVETGYSDGQNTMIISGLSEGERLVSTGTYRIKLSQMTTTAPAHNHEH